jgi:N-methylhydantoinase A
MQSSGGMMTAAEAAEFPVRLLESGPAAGVLAAASVARQTSAKTAIGFDMGGTTAKAALLEDGSPSYATEFSVGSAVSASSRLLRGGGYAVRLPVVDLAEIGAGGGSIASVDGSGGLSVGPRSAGADPGPACYGRGGARPTVTDANLVLGYLAVEGLARGGVTARPDLAREVIERDVASPLGLSVEDAARAIHAVANQLMARVLRAVTTERGRAVEDQTLIVSGGSGAIHAAGLADTVGISAIVVPPRAGVLSAVGLLRAPMSLTAVETVAGPLDDSAVESIGTKLRALATGLRRRMTLDGLDLSRAVVRYVVDLRYRGQATELALDLPSDDVAPAMITTLAERFDADHLLTYGHAGHRPIEVVRVRVTVAIDSPQTPQAPTNPTQPSTPGTRPAIFDGSLVPVSVRTRASLSGVVTGPLLVDEPDTTVVVPPNWSAAVDSDGNLTLERVR